MEGSNGPGSRTEAFNHIAKRYPSGLKCDFKNFYFQGSSDSATPIRGFLNTHLPPHNIKARIL